MHKLQEDRVRRVLEPMLEGSTLPEQVKPDDIEYAIDLGLLTRTANGLQIANPIYREVIPRELGYVSQLELESLIRPAWYIEADGRLNMEKLLAAFQTFFRENAEHWVGRFDYREAGPQLLMQAFLQRIVNGGGQVHREYGLGHKRTDLLVVWSYPGGIQKTVIELKIRYKALEETIKEGLAQTRAYMDQTDSQDGHLIIFDRTKDKAWSDKIFRRTESYQGQGITIWGM